VLTFSTPLPDRFGGIPEDSKDPALVRNEVGSGRTFFFACDFGAAVWKWRMPDHLALAREVLGDGADDLLKMPSDAPPCLDLSLRRSRDGGSVLLHLVNYNGGMTRPIERVLPIHDLTLQVRLRPRTTRALFRPAALETRSDGPWLSVRLPVLGEYELTRFEL
jgi:hypothetical protein